MVVLLDLEWISDNGDHPTQLSAKRVDRDWNEQSCLDVLVQPPEHCFAHRGHMAFGGLDEALYRAALPLGDCMLTFSEWLEPLDVIWLWSEDALRLLDNLWRAAVPSRSLPLQRIRDVDGSLVTTDRYFSRRRK